MAQKPTENGIPEYVLVLLMAAVWWGNAFVFVMQHAGCTIVPFSGPVCP